MTRTERLALADAAIDRATALAQNAERAAYGDARALAEPLANIGFLWARIARSHTAIAAAMADTADTTPEV